MNDAKIYEDRIMERLRAINSIHIKRNFCYARSLNNQRRTYFPYIPVSSDIAYSLLDIVEEDGFLIRRMIRTNYQAGKTTSTTFLVGSIRRVGGGI